MHKPALTAAALLLAAPAAQAVTITADAATDTVTLAGTLNWSVVADAIGTIQDSTDYLITLQLSGSPFAADFTLPAVDAEVPLSGPTTISVENPKVGFGTQTVSGLSGGFGIASTPPATYLPEQVMVFEQMVRQFAAGSLDGDISYQFAVGFDEDFSTITEVVAGLAVRTPLIGTDYFSTETYLGIDSVDAIVRNDAIGGGGGSTGGEGSTGGDGSTGGNGSTGGGGSTGGDGSAGGDGSTGATPTPVPVPAGGLLLASGLLGLASLRRQKKG